MRPLVGRPRRRSRSDSLRWLSSHKFNGYWRCMIHDLLSLISTWTRVHTLTFWSNSHKRRQCWNEVDLGREKKLVENIRKHARIAWAGSLDDRIGFSLTCQKEQWMLFLWIPLQCLSKYMVQMYLFIPRLYLTDHYLMVKIWYMGSH